MTQGTGKTPVATKKTVSRKTKAESPELETVVKGASTKTGAKSAAAAGAAAKSDKPTRKPAAQPVVAAAKPAAAAKKVVSKDKDEKSAAKPRAPKIATGRKPGRPAKNANGDGADYVDDDADGGEVIPDLKPLPKRGGKRAKGEKESPARSQMTPEEQEARRNRLKILIKLGKDRGYLTYGEINDHLPDDLVDAEAIDGIISTFNDMGIKVYDQAPDAETLLIVTEPDQVCAHTPTSPRGAP